MSALHPFLAILSVTLSAQPSPTDTIPIPDAAQRSAMISQSNQEPVMVKEWEAIVARDSLVGLWEVTHLEQQAKARPELATQLHVRFSRGRIELFQAGCAPKVVAYNLDTKDDPPRLDWYEYRGAELRLQRGVYWIQGDTLLLCLGPINGRRATEFLSTPYDGRTLFAMKRVEANSELPPKK